jgi:hypothetical protein
MALTTDPLIARSKTAEGDSTTFRKRRGTLLIVDDEDGPRQSLRVIFKDEYDLLMGRCWTFAWPACRALKFWNASNT